MLGNIPRTTLAGLLMVSVVMAASVGVTVIIGANAVSSGTDDFTHHITKSDIDEDKCYWLNHTGLVVTNCNDPRPDNAEHLVEFTGGSNATNYIVWSDTTETDNSYCDLYIIDQNSADRKVLVGAENNITICSMCTHNFTVYGYVVFKNTTAIQAEETCTHGFRTYP